MRVQSHNIVDVRNISAPFDPIQVQARTYPEIMRPNPEAKSERRFPKQLKTVGLVLFTVAIVWWLTRSLNWTEVRQSLGKADWKLLTAATIAVSFTYLLRACRWRALLSPLAKTSLADTFAATVVGFGAVFLVGRGGEVVRPALLPLRDRRVRPAASFITIAIERICDLLAVVFLFAINLMWFNAPAAHVVEVKLLREIGLILLIGACGGVVLLVLFERRANTLITWLDTKLQTWSFVPEKVRGALLNVLTQLATALRVLAYPQDLARTVFWTGLVWFTIVIGNVFIFRAFGVPFGIQETIFVLGWGLVGSLVPTPGGAAGAFHAATAAGLLFLGIAREQAVAISIMVHLIDFAPAVFLGLGYLVTGEISFAGLRRLSRDKEAPALAEQ